MTCLAHKKHLIYCVVLPSLFWSFHWSKTNTKHKWTIKLTFKLGPMKIKWVLPHWWRYLQNNSLFPPIEKYEKYTSDAHFHDTPFWSNNSQFEWIINELFTHGTWKEGWYGWKQPNLPCRLALLACWCDCCFSIIATVYVIVQTSRLISG